MVVYVLYKVQYWPIPSVCQSVPASGAAKVSCLQNILGFRSMALQWDGPSQFKKWEGSNQKVSYDCFQEGHLVGQQWAHCEEFEPWWTWCGWTWPFTLMRSTGGRRETWQWLAIQVLPQETQLLISYHTCTFTHSHIYSTSPTIKSKFVSGGYFYINFIMNYFGNTKKSLKDTTFTRCYNFTGSAILSV